VFIDVDEGSFNIDLEAATKAVSTKTKAMVYVHLYGRMGEPSRVEQFATRHGLTVIEDAAQAIGATYGARPAGSLGTVSCFSFDPTKTISAPGSGGAVLTDDDGLAEKVRGLRYHGKGPNGRFQRLGYNSQMPNLTAALLRRKLELDEEWLARRSAIAARYAERLEDTAAVTPSEPDGTIHCFHKYVVRVPDRERVRAELSNHGIPTRIHYPEPLHIHPCFEEAARVGGSIPVVERLCGEVLSLPIHPFLRDEEVDKVADALAVALD
jgi:dTDP-4-amino-4,6-dideoxygalactose transaminase